MSEERLFPGYIAREEEQQILREVEHVQADRRSRAVLLYGRGGVGKTSLVRALASAGGAGSQTVWVDPVDIDDSGYWLLSSLEQHVADGLDPRNQNRFFKEYRDHLARLPAYTRPRVGYETVVSHLARIKQVFAGCYQKFINDGDGGVKTVVIVLDTVEVIRGMYLLQTLTQWMKGLPGTLFILAGRPARGPEDPIQTELADPHQPLPVTTISLGEFAWDSAVHYLKRSGVASGLSDGEMAKLVHLTQGHPLWLAFTVNYLQSTGVPEEAAEARLEAIAADMPFRGEISPAGRARAERFKRRLIAPYHESDFWHEALRRLAVVRESINRQAWQQLMADRPPPPGVPDLAGAWDRLLQIPWIRPRANRHYVTLHDAVAEELALRLIPIHDRGKHWRRQLWRRAEGIYAEQAREIEANLAGDLDQLDGALHSWAARLERGDERLPADEQAELTDEAGRLEASRRELSQIRAVGLYYELLCDFEAGSRRFLHLMEQAKAEHDILFQNLLAAEIQRFLPAGVHAHASGDVVGEIIDEFREWLTSEERRGVHVEVGVSLADHLIRAERPEQAISLLDTLPADSASPRQRYRLHTLHGNAWMRVPGHFKDALQHFDDALMEAVGLQPESGLRLVAKAHKELGFYYRNGGMWKDADASYQQARDAISDTLLAGSEREDREEMASIQTNWAYVKGLTGDYRVGVSLAQSAITIRQRLGNKQEEGNSWSVLGEVYRYERRFAKAWEAYAEAERVFQQLRNWAWLGLIYQEQAICLLQAYRDGATLIDDDPMAEARRLITVSLDLCRDLSVRAYPSALNRAGRIYGDEDPDVGLQYLAEGIEEGRRHSDGWFWFANMIEHAEMCYRAWVRTGRPGYRDRIGAHEAGIAEAMVDYEFPDLKGRWELLEGHLLVHQALDAGDDSGLSSALEHYKNGFALIAQQYVGSSGAAAVAGEFETLGQLVRRLPPVVRAEWQITLRRAWSQEESAATLLLAGLEQLY